MHSSFFIVYKLSNIGIQGNYVNKKTHNSFFIATNFEIWAYKGMKIHFLLETLKLSQMTPFHTIIIHIFTTT